jgi:hypothetical protein
MTRRALIIGGETPLGALCAERLNRLGRSVAVLTDHLASAESLRALNIEVFIGDAKDPHILAPAVMGRHEVYLFTGSLEASSLASSDEGHEETRSQRLLKWRGGADWMWFALKSVLYQTPISSDRDSEDRKGSAVEMSSPSSHSGEDLKTYSSKRSLLKARPTLAHDLSYCRALHIALSLINQGQTLDRLTHPEVILILSARALLPSPSEQQTRRELDDLSLLEGKHVFVGRVYGVAPIPSTQWTPLTRRLLGTLLTLRADDQEIIEPYVYAGDVIDGVLLQMARGSSSAPICIWGDRLPQAVFLEMAIERRAALGVDRRVDRLRARAVALWTLIRDRVTQRLASLIRKVLRRPLPPPRTSLYPLAPTLEVKNATQRVGYEWRSSSRGLNALYTNIEDEEPEALSR